MALVAQGGSDDLHNCCTNRLMGRGNDNHNKGRDEVMNTEILLARAVGSRVRPPHDL